MKKETFTEERIDKAIKNLKRGKYQGKIVSADYSNLGIRLFEWGKLADDLGIGSWYRLEKMLNLGKEDVCGWNLSKKPTEKDLLGLKHKLKYRTPKLEKYLRNHKKRRR